MKCPVCTTSDLLMSDRQGVEIDYCPQCRGVWLDRGELDKIIDRSSTAATQEKSTEPEEQRYREPDHHAKHDHGHDDHHGSRSGKGKSYKKKSLLKELFDF